MSSQFTSLGRVSILPLSVIYSSLFNLFSTFYTLNSRVYSKDIGVPSFYKSDFDIEFNGILLVYILFGDFDFDLG